MMKSYIDTFIEALRDGKWHNTQEILEKTRVEEKKAKLVMSFLEEFQFIQVDTAKNRVRLNILTKRFLEKLEKTNNSLFYEKITA